MSELVTCPRCFGAGKTIDSISLSNVKIDPVLERCVLCRREGQVAEHVAAAYRLGGMGAVRSLKRQEHGLAG